MKTISATIMKCLFSATVLLILLALVIIVPLLCDHFSSYHREKERKNYWFRDGFDYSKDELGAHDILLHILLDQYKDLIYPAAMLHGKLLNTEQKIQTKPVSYSTKNPLDISVPNSVLFQSLLLNKGQTTKSLSQIQSRLRSQSMSQSLKQIPERVDSATVNICDDIGNFMELVHRNTGLFADQIDMTPHSPYRAKTDTYGNRAALTEAQKHYDIEAAFNQLLIHAMDSHGLNNPEITIAEYLHHEGIKTVDVEPMNKLGQCQGNSIAFLILQNCIIDRVYMCSILDLLSLFASNDMMKFPVLRDFIDTLELTMILRYGTATDAQQHKRGDFFRITRETLLRFPAVRQIGDTGYKARETRLLYISDILILFRGLSLATDILQSIVLISYPNLQWWCQQDGAVPDKTTNEKDAAFLNRQSAAAYVDYKNRTLADLNRNANIESSPNHYIGGFGYYLMNPSLGSNRLLKDGTDLLMQILIHRIGFRCPYFTCVFANEDDNGDPLYISLRSDKNSVVTTNSAYGTRIIRQSSLKSLLNSCNAPLLMSVHKGHATVHLMDDYWKLLRQQKVRDNSFPIMQPWQSTPQPDTTLAPVTALPKTRYLSQASRDVRGVQREDIREFHDMMRQSKLHQSDFPISGSTKNVTRLTDDETSELLNFVLSGDTAGAFTFLQQKDIHLPLSAAQREKPLSCTGVDCDVASIGSSTADLIILLRWLLLWQQRGYSTATFKLESTIAKNDAGQHISRMRSLLVADDVWYPSEELLESLYMHLDDIVKKNDTNIWLLSPIARDVLAIIASMRGYPNGEDMRLTAEMIATIERLLSSTIEPEQPDPISEVALFLLDNIRYSAPIALHLLRISKKITAPSQEQLKSMRSMMAYVDSSLRQVQAHIPPDVAYILFDFSEILDGSMISFGAAYSKLVTNLWYLHQLCGDDDYAYLQEQLEKLRNHDCSSLIKDLSNGDLYQYLADSQSLLLQKDDQMLTKLELKQVLESSKDTGNEYERDIIEAMIMLL